MNCTPSRLLLAVAVFMLHCIVLTGCDKAPEQGEVARVNGRSITARQLAASHEIGTIYGAMYASRTATQLQEEYGLALADLIVCVLVEEALEKEKIPVSEAELYAAEQEIRADYPGDFFEEMLLEEGIDIDSWRFILKNKLIMTKFVTKVLRTKISVHPDEIAQYYEAHQESYAVPEVYNFYSIQGGRKKDVELARDLFLKTASVHDVAMAFPAVQVVENMLPLDRISPTALEAVRTKKAFASTPVVAEDAGYTSYVFKKFTAARVRPVSEVYTQVEQALLEPKLEQAMEAWLAGRLAKAKVFLDVRLLPQLGPAPLFVQGGAGEQNNGTDTIPLAQNATFMAINGTHETGGTLYGANNSTENIWSNATFVPEEIEVD